MATKWIYEKRLFKDTWIRHLSSDNNVQVYDGSIPGLHLRYSPSTHSISFFLSCMIRMTGKRKNLYLGKLHDFENVEQIKDKARCWRQTILDGGNPMETQREIVKAQVLAEANKKKFETIFYEYMEKYSNLYKKPRTIESNWAEYRLYMKDIFGDMYIEDVEEQHVLDAYAAWAKKTSFSTANKVLSLLSSFWDWCESYKYLPRRSNPCPYVRKGPREKFQPTVLDQEGYKKLFHWLDVGLAKGSRNHPRLFRTIKVLALTGCRSSEITDLEIDEVLLDEKKIHLKDSKTGARDVPLADAAIKELKKALEETKNIHSKYVFPGLRDPNRPIDNIRKAFEWALKQAGLPHMRLHDLRHSFITMGANMGESMNAMKDAAGHSRITTTEMYTHLTHDKAFEAINHITEAICE